MAEHAESGVSNALPGVILAGGLARRMGGGDKGLRRLQGRPLLSHVIDRLAPQVTALALNANGPPERFHGFGLTVLPDPVTGFVGPLAGILAAMDWAAGLGADRVVTAAADTPFLPRDLVARLTRAVQGRDLPLALAATAGPEGQMRHPPFGLWPVALRNDLRQALSDGTRKVTQWADQHGAGAAVFPAAPVDPFFNINTPADLDRAAVLAASLS